MEEITEVYPNVYFVTSEPGDATRYDFLVYRDGPDELCFAPRRSTFRFPQRLNFWEVRDLTPKELIEKAVAEGCNPHTLTESIRIMKAILGRIEYSTLPE